MIPDRPSVTVSPNLFWTAFGQQTSFIWTDIRELVSVATYSKGSLRERSKGHWQAHFCRTDRNGSSIVTRSFEATSRRAATLIMEDIRRELIEQDGDGASSRELIAYMLDYADERERSQQIEASTATNYRSSIKHLARYLEGYSIEEIAPENVMDVQVALLADGLVADTVAKDHRFFKQVMDYACKMGHIHRSPFNKATKPPKRRKPRPNALDERSRSMLLSVLDASPTTKQSVAARLGLLAGLRREEVAGLRWGDVDLVANRIRVGRAVGVSNDRPYLKGTKTEAGEREAVLEKGLADTLRSLRSSLGVSAREDRYVLGDGDSFYTPDRITKDFTSLAKAMNLIGVAGKRATFHDLRDTFATRLISQGVNVKTVSYLLGHANAAMTLNVYTSTGTP